MQLLPLRILALTIAVALSVAGCAASTKIVNQWTSPDYTSPRFKKIMVIGVSTQPSIRRTFEDEFVTKLKAAGIEALPSYLYIPEDGQVDESRLQAAVKQAGADAVIITRLVRVDKKSEVSPRGSIDPGQLDSTAAIRPRGSATTNLPASINTMYTSRKPVCTT